MRLRPTNYEKELKKTQNKGLYNKKLKIAGVVGVIIGTALIYTTYAFFNYNSNRVLGFNSNVNKDINIIINTTNSIIKKNNYIKNNTLAAKILANNTVKNNPTFNTSHNDSGLFVQSGSGKTINGDPTYYFRGAVENNYVNFANQIWRIVRINEDGSVRLISQNQYARVNYSDVSSTNYMNSNIKNYVDKWYDSLSTNDKNYIATAYFCNDTTNTAQNRYNNNATFACNNENLLLLKAGLITADEAIYSGASLSNYSSTYIGDGWSWTMSAANNSNMFIILTSGDETHKKAGVWNYESSISAENSRDYHYVINLRAEALYASGNGTSTSPYTVSGISTENDKITLKTNYNKEEAVYINPYDGYDIDTINCTNGQTASYDSKLSKLTIKATKDTVCTVSFKDVNLNHVILANNPVKGFTQDFSKGYPLQNDSNKSGLYKTQDDQGDSYYFRGAVENNYVKFGKDKIATPASSTANDLIWRILRINGDGSIRMILDYAINTSAFNNLSSNFPYVGYTDNKSSGKACTLAHPCEVTYNNKSFSNTKFGGTNSTIKTNLENWYITNLDDVDDKIKLGYFCNDTTLTNNVPPVYYGAYTRLVTNHNPSLKCPDSNVTYGGLYKTKIGLITADEMVLAGIGSSTTDNNYLYDSDYVLSLSPSMFDRNAKIITSNESHIYYNMQTDVTYFMIYPVINLNSNVTISQGDGTKNNPYVINT